MKNTKEVYALESIQKLLIEKIYPLLDVSFEPFTKRVPARGKFQYLYDEAPKITQIGKDWFIVFNFMCQENNGDKQWFNLGYQVDLKKARIKSTTQIGSGALLHNPDYQFAFETFNAFITHYPVFKATLKHEIEIIRKN